MKDDFYKSLKEAFKDNYDALVSKLNEPYTQGFFINELNGDKDDILKLIDFDYHKSDFNDSGYFHNENNIGKTKAYELGLIYPQNIESSFSSSLIDFNPKLIVDLCAAPGGKSINFINKFKDAFCVCNDVDYKRSIELSKNLERLGLTNTIITNKKIDDLVNLLKGNADLVIVDAPCSGEGIVRKYPFVIDEYSNDNVNNLVNIQKDLLDNAYKLVKKDGLIVYSTCTYNLNEDEYQVKEFLNKHTDIELVNLISKYNYSNLKGTIKLCPLNGTEGQFISCFRKLSENESSKLRYLKESDNIVVKDFINNNLNISNYYLYSNNNNYFMSFDKLIDLNDNVIRKGIVLGELKNNRFEPAHQLYRSVQLINCFKNVIDINDNEYNMYIQGYEIKKNLKDAYYLITFKGFSLGFVKCSNGTLKNKYPKGLRRAMI